MDKNVFGESVDTCSNKPLTGYFRDGCCNSDKSDAGNHSVCAIVTKEFLDFSKERGNDLITPRPEYEFPGLVPGDHWCLCAARWLEAYKNGKAPFVNLSATNERALEVIPMDLLIQFAK